MPTNDVIDREGDGRASAAGLYLRRERLFYVIAAFISLLVSLTGFRHFYYAGQGFGGNPLTHQIVPLILTHAFAMSSWVVLFLVQSLLIRSGKFRLHMLLGRVGGALAVAIVGLGSAMAILSAHHNPQAYLMFSGGKFFLMEMLTEILLFGVLVAIGIAWRRRAEIHRPVMLVATVVIMSGALARCPLIDYLAATGPLYAYGPVLLFGLLMLALHCAITRRFQRYHAMALGAVAIVFLLSMPLGHSAAWQQLLGSYIP